MTTLTIAIGYAIVIVYIIGALIMLGIRGGIQDEMEGIADLFYVFLWPIALPCYVLFWIGGAIVNVGILIKEKGMKL